MMLHDVLYGFEVGQSQIGWDLVCSSLLVAVAVTSLRHIRILFVALLAQGFSFSCSAIKLNLVRCSRVRKFSEFSEIPAFSVTSLCHRKYQYVAMVVSTRVVLPCLGWFAGCLDNDGLFGYVSLFIMFALCLTRLGFVNLGCKVFFFQ